MGSIPSSDKVLIPNEIPVRRMHDWSSRFLSADQVGRFPIHHAPTHKGPASAHTDGLAIRLGTLKLTLPIVLWVCFDLVCDQDCYHDTADMAHD